MLTVLHQEPDCEERNHDHDLAGQGLEEVHLCPQGRVAFGQNRNFEADYSRTAGS